LIFDHDFLKMLRKDFRKAKTDPALTSFRISDRVNDTKIVKYLIDASTAVDTMGRRNIVGSNTKNIIDKRKAYKSKYEAALRMPLTGKSHFNLIYMPITIGFGGNALRDPKVLTKMGIKYDILPIDSMRDRAEIVYHDMPLLIFNAKRIREHVADSEFESIYIAIENLEASRKVAKGKLVRLKRTVKDMNDGTMDIEKLKVERDGVRASIITFESRVKQGLNRLKTLRKDNPRHEEMDEDKKQEIIDVAKNTLAVYRSSAARNRARLKELESILSKDGTDLYYVKLIGKVSLHEREIITLSTELKIVKAKLNKLENSLVHTSSAQTVNSKKKTSAPTEDRLLKAGLDQLITMINSRISDPLIRVSDSILGYGKGKTTVGKHGSANSLVLLMPLNIWRMFDGMGSGVKVHSWNIPWNANADYSKLKAIVAEPNKLGSPK